MLIEGISVGDYLGWPGLNQQTKTDSSEALLETGTQFDAFFLQFMLKSNNIEQHFTHGPSPFIGNNYEKIQCIFDGKFANIIPPVFHESPAQLVTPQADSQAASAVEKKETGIGQSVDDFVNSVWPFARQASALLGLDPKILVAQAALETGWGHFIAKDKEGNSTNNLFNIKAHTDNPEQAVEIKTTEFIADTPVKMMASFKKYPSVEHSFQDYISLIKANHRYEAALANARDPKRYVEALQGAGYASDPNYARKILSIYHSDELQQALERNGCTKSI